MGSPRTAVTRSLQRAHMQVEASYCTLSDQDHQGSFSKATHRLSSLLPKWGRNCKELPAAFGGQAAPLTVATPEALGPYPPSNLSHQNPCRREVHRNQVSRTQQCHPLTENVSSVLFMETTHQKSVACLPAKHGDQIKH